MSADEPRFTSDPKRYEHWVTGRLSNYINVGDMERTACTLGGGLIALLGLSRRSLPGALLALAGGYMAQRGMSGHCVVYEALDISTAPHSESPPHPSPEEAQKPVAYKPAPEEKVEQASWESFPASDAPSWSGGIT